MQLKRILFSRLQQRLNINKSVLLLGARQTGKTTLVQALDAKLTINLANPIDRLRYEKDPRLLTYEIEALHKTKKKPPALIIIDEIQKIPLLLDAAQDLIDRKLAQFVLTGSSARKIRRTNVNLLPGRVIPLRLDPLVWEELPDKISLESLLLAGSLPEIALTENKNQQDTLLEAYVTTYLEEEIRAEAIVRDLGSFARFLELAASESGNIINFTKLSHTIGVAISTIANYYQILEDCLVAERIEPMTKTAGRRKLVKSQKYLLFDLGVRRLAAKEGRKLSRTDLGRLFEQYIGLELIRQIRAYQYRMRLHFWRDTNGPEVDWILQTGKRYLPIETKLTDAPNMDDAKHLKLFLDEYTAENALIVCQTPRPLKLSRQITAIPWQQLHTHIAEFADG